MIYIVGWVGMLISCCVIKYRFGRLFVYIVLSYLMFVSFFRGDVGTDTANYIVIFNKIASGDSVGFGEIGFYYLSKMLLFFLIDPVWAVKAVSIVFFTMLGVFFFKADENERFLFVSYILPVFAYSYSMNGLRVGIAFSVLLLVFQHVSKRDRGNKDVMYLVAPSLFHLSLMAFPFFFVTYRVGLFSCRAALSVVFLVVVGGGVFLFAGEYFLAKMSLYDGYESPSIFSGARVVIPLILILIGCLLGGLPSEDKAKVVSISLMFVIVAIVLTQISYAGLRVLDLLSFFIPLAILNSYGKRNKCFGFNMKAAFIVAGVVSAIAIYSGYVKELGQGQSPFLPYEFVF